MSRKKPGKTHSEAPFELERPCRLFAKIQLDDAAGNIFDYGIPDLWCDSLQPGHRVRVPLRQRSVTGTVLSISQQTEVRGVRPILALLNQEPALTPNLLQLAQWIAGYYCCSLDLAIRGVLPQVIRKSEMGHREHLFATLSPSVSSENICSVEKRAPSQAAILDALQKAPSQSIQISTLAKDVKGAHAAVRALEKRGWIRVAAQTTQRIPDDDLQFVPSSPLTLNTEQAEVCSQIVSRLEPTSTTTAPKPILLHGVTGSGKTEVYLQCISKCLDSGRNAIVLVPEISLTPQTVERFKSRFAGSGHEVAVLHSHLSDGERHDEWHRIRAHKARIVIGARSAIFAPLANLGLIVVDEEHEPSYKQEEIPRYHARDVAVVRGHIERCAVLLGSATPSIESFENAVTGKYDLLRMTARVDDRKLPFIRIVDMRNEPKNSSRILSSKLLAAMDQRLQRKEQTILFLNRRGFSTSLLCEGCGHVEECRNCAVSLTYHRDINRVVCHICGYIAIAPKACRECHDPRIKHRGSGTEKVEDAVVKIFPKAVVKRMDADVMQRKGAFRETLGAFRAGKIDILVGTQMIAKGLDFPRVTLVGIINADVGLQMPDFRAGERTFQLLTQVAGRAGRGEIEGEVFVQTFTPHHPSIQFARHHDFEGFRDQEIEFRRQWNYPPFSHLILIGVRSENEQLATFTADQIHRSLAEGLPANTILGEPGIAPLAKSHNQHRLHLMVRSKSIRKLTAHVSSRLEKLTVPKDVIVTTDVDAYQLL
jgi:primosomal protein N' (replication factor Y)